VPITNGGWGGGGVGDMFKSTEEDLSEESRHPGRKHKPGCLEQEVDGDAR
jgi:hypothetical protein